MNTEFTLTVEQTHLLYTLVEEYVTKGGHIVSGGKAHCGCSPEDLEALLTAVGEADRLVLTNED